MLPGRLTTTIVVALLLLCTACGNNTTVLSQTPPLPVGQEPEDTANLVKVRMAPAKPHDPLFASQMSHAASFALDTAQAFSQLPHKHTSFALNYTGASFSPALPNRNVQANGASLNFMPSYGQGGSLDLAYAMYHLDLQGYGPGSGEQTLTLNFSLPPSDTSKLWIGLGDVNLDRFIWFESEADHTITVDDFTRFENPGDGSVLVALVGLGAYQITLDGILIGLYETRAAGESYPPFPFTPAAEIPNLGPVFISGVDLSPECAPINDQGGIGSCTGFGSTDGALNFELHHLYPSCWTYANAGLLTSPRYTYIQSGHDLSVPDPCPDAGRATNDVCNWLATHGASSEANAPYGSRNAGMFDCSSAWSAGALGDVAVLHPASANFIGTANPSEAGKYYLTDANINQIKSQLLTAHHVVVFRSYLDGAFGSTDYAGGQSWTFTGPRGGGHCMCIVGYDNNLNGGSFKVRNSWSSSWGDGGYCYITYAGMKSQGAACYGLWFNMDYDTAVPQRFCPGPIFFPIPLHWRVQFPPQTDKVTLQWDTPPGVFRYKIFRDDPTILIATPTAGENSFDDDTLQDFNAHVYWIQADYGNASSDLSPAIFGWKVP